MQLKPITVIIVLLLVVASLSVAGCQMELTPTVENQAGNVSTDYPTSGRSKLVEACVNDEKTTAESRNRTVNVVWYSDTKAAITLKYKSGMDDITSAYTYIHFPTVEAANTYFDSQRGIYEYRPAKIISGPVDYAGLTGHKPTIYKQLRDMSRSLAEITQYDTLVVESNYEIQMPVNQAQEVATPSATWISLR